MTGAIRRRDGDPMHLTRQIFQFAAAAVATVLLAGAAAAFSDEAVKDAEEFLARTKDRFQVGESRGPTWRRPSIICSK